MSKNKSKELDKIFRPSVRRLIAMMNRDISIDLLNDPDYIKYYGTISSTTQLITIVKKNAEDS